MDHCWELEGEQRWRVEFYSVAESVLVFDPSLSSRIQFGWTSVSAAIFPPSLSQQSQNYFAKFVSGMESATYGPGVSERLLVNCFADEAGRWRRAKKAYQEVTSSTWSTLLSVLWLIADFLSFLSLSFLPLHQLSPQEESSQLQLQTLSHYANDFPIEKPRACRPSIQQGLQFEYVGIFFPSLHFSIFVKRMSYFWCIAMVFPSLQWRGGGALNQFLQPPLEYMLLLCDIEGNYTNVWGIASDLHPCKSFTLFCSASLPFRTHTPHQDLKKRAKEIA